MLYISRLVKLLSVHEICISLLLPFFFFFLVLVLMEVIFHVHTSPCIQQMALVGRRHLAPSDPTVMESHGGLLYLAARIDHKRVR